MIPQACLPSTAAALFSSAFFWLASHFSSFTIAFSSSVLRFSSVFLISSSLLISFFAIFSLAARWAVGCCGSARFETAAISGVDSAGCFATGGVESSFMISVWDPEGFVASSIFCCSWAGGAACWAGSTFFCSTLTSSFFGSSFFGSSFSGSTFSGTGIHSYFSSSKWWLRICQFEIFRVS